MRILLPLLFLSICPVASATDYYVKNGGNNNSDGKSDATAWATISKVNSTALLPGDIVYFRCGDRWRETLEVPGSGSSNAYIKFTKYGEGLNPKIVGSNAATGWTNTGGNVWKSNNTFQNPKNAGYGSADIYFENSDNTKKRGLYKSSTSSLTDEYNWAYSSSYIYVFSTGDPGTRYKSVEVPQRDASVYTNNQSYLHFDGIDVHYGAFTGFDGTTHNDVRDYTGCIIENCEISCIGGISPEQYGFGTNIVFSDMVIRNCLFYYCGRRSISMNMQAEGSFTVENVIIEKNIFRWGSHTTALDLTCNNGGTGLAGYNGIIFRYNLVEEEQGVSVSYPVNQMWFQNYSGTGSINNVYIYSNIFKYWRENCIATEGVKGNMFVYNNTFYENNSTGGSYGYSYGIYSDSDVSTFRMNIKNNIFYSTYKDDRGAFIVPYGISESHYICDYNLYYRINNNLRVWFPNGSVYYMEDIAKVRSQLGWEMHSPTPSNPLFVSSIDLHLQTGSPALGKGILISNVEADFEGNAYSNPPNIGSYSSTGVAPVLTYLSSVIANAAPSILEMTYNLALANIVPAASAFSVTVNSTARTVSSVSVSGTKVSLTLASPVAYGDVVTVAYTKPATNPLQTSTGGQAASITAQAVTNNVAAPPSIPTYVSSLVANATPSVLEITYNLTLANIVPAASAFSVTVNSAARTVSSVAVSGTKVSLTLASPVAYGNVVTVAYTKPATNPLQTSSGGQAASITAQAVTNNVAAPPSIPTYVSSLVANATPSVLEMTYNLTLANIVPAASAFSVTVNSTARTVSSVSVSGTKVSLTLASPVAYGDVVTVAYTKPAANPLQTPSGGQAASITAQAVTNNVAAPPSVPTYVSSLVANATPSVLEITYNLTLANIVPAASAFSVTVNSAARTVSSVAVSGTKVSLTLASPVAYGDVVTVAYTKPATNPLQTPSGGQAASITAQAVTNNVAAPPSVPTYVSSLVANTTPSVLEMTYNLTLANIVPAASAFSVTVNSAARTVSSVAVSGTKVSLTLASPVAYGDVVTVAYTKPATNPLQTPSGGQAASITAQAVTNNVAAPPSVPTYVSSLVANTTPSVLEMTYNLTLANIVPATSAFSVMVNSAARTVSSVAVSGTKVSLTLASPVAYGDVVTVAYTKPATNPLQTSTGGQAASITAQAVTNNVAAPPAVPAYVSSLVANATPSVLEMTYNLTLANIVPATSAFSVMVNSAARTVSSVAVSGTKVSLTLASPMAYGDVVTVAYTKPATNPLQTSTGGQAASITAQAVTNNVAAPPAVPAYVSSLVANATPSVLEMTYNLTLANIVPAASAFSVTVNSAARTVSSVAVSGTKVSLTLASPVAYGDVVTVAYTKPATNPLQTSSGGQAASITAQAVTNNVAAPPAVPAYVSSLVANATPSVLEMTYNLTLANIVPAASAFSVTVNSAARTVSSVAVSGTKVSLTLASPVAYGDVVTVAYTKPATNPLQTSIRRPGCQYHCPGCDK